MSPCITLLSSGILGYKRNSANADCAVANAYQEVFGSRASFQTFRCNDRTNISILGLPELLGTLYLWCSFVCVGIVWQIFSEGSERLPQTERAYEV